ncbi:MAG: ABC transporter ATP-binding protein [Pseudomonadota bacterium]
MALLEFRNVCASYGPIAALNDVSIVVENGEIVTLVGANGAGKSTLLMTIFGAPPCSSGKIYFEGQDISTLQTHEVSRLGIAQVPEGRRVFQSMTVEENLYMGTTPIGDRYLKEDLEKVYSLFPRLRDRRLQRSGTMSGGEQQMLAIGRALMMRPKLLLLDEPSLGLAPLIVNQIFSTIKDISKTGTTVFLVEQNANQALKIAHRGYVLVNGRIQLSGTGKDLLGNADVRKAYLGE